MDFRSQEITRSKRRALVEGTLMRSLMLPIRVFSCTSCYVSMELITSMSLVSAHPGSYSILRHLKSIFVVWIFYRKYAWKWWVYLQKYFLINDKNAKIYYLLSSTFILRVKKCLDPSYSLWGVLWWKVWMIQKHLLSLFSILRVTSGHRGLSHKQPTARCPLMGLFPPLPFRGNAIHTLGHKGSSFCLNDFNKNATLAYF